MSDYPDYSDYHYEYYTGSPQPWERSASSEAPSDPPGTAAGPVNDGVPDARRKSADLVDTQLEDTQVARQRETIAQFRSSGPIPQAPSDSALSHPGAANPSTAFDPEALHTDLTAAFDRSDFLPTAYPHSFAVSEGSTRQPEDARPGTAAAGPDGVPPARRDSMDKAEKELEDWVSERKAPPSLKDTARQFSMLLSGLNEEGNAPINVRTKVAAFMPGIKTQLKAAKKEYGRRMLLAGQTRVGPPPGGTITGEGGGKKFTDLGRDWVITRYILGNSKTHVEAALSNTKAITQRPAKDLVNLAWPTPAEVDEAVGKVGPPPDGTVTTGTDGDKQLTEVGKEWVKTQLGNGNREPYVALQLSRTWQLGDPAALNAAEAIELVENARDKPLQAAVPAGDGGAGQAEGAGPGTAAAGPVNDGVPLERREAVAEAEKQLMKWAARDAPPSLKETASHFSMLLRGLHEEGKAAINVRTKVAAFMPRIEPQLKKAKTEYIRGIQLAGQAKVGPPPDGTTTGEGAGKTFTDLGHDWVITQSILGNGKEYVWRVLSNTAAITHETGRDLVYGAWPEAAEVDAAVAKVGPPPVGTVTTGTDGDKQLTEVGKKWVKTQLGKGNREPYVALALSRTLQSRTLQLGDPAAPDVAEAIKLVENARDELLQAAVPAGHGGAAAGPSSSPHGGEQS